MPEINVLARPCFAIQYLFGRASFGMDDVAVHPGEAYRLNAPIAQGGENIGIDGAGKNHFGHLEGGIVGDAPAIDNCLFDAHSKCQIAQLFAAAVHHA